MTEIKEIIKETGKVKWFNPTLKYGFIKCDNEKYYDDIFFHKSQILSEVGIDTKVEFELKKSDKGWLAKKVKTI